MVSGAPEDAKPSHDEAEEIEQITTEEGVASAEESARKYRKKELTKPRGTSSVIIVHHYDTFFPWCKALEDSVVYRDEVVREMLKSEKKYIADLTLLIEVRSNCFVFSLACACGLCNLFTKYAAVPEPPAGVKHHFKGANCEVCWIS
jgi:hypothetical protein